MDIAQVVIHVGGICLKHFLHGGLQLQLPQGVGQPADHRMQAVLSKSLDCQDCACNAMFGKFCVMLQADE